MPGTASWNTFDASRAWKNTSGFCAVPRTLGRFGVRLRNRCASRSSSEIKSISVESGITAIFDTSWDVRKPSKKWRIGTWARSVAACEIAAMSCASWTDADASIANAVCRAPITSEWSPKMLSAWVAIERAATCITIGDNSPAILYMLGSMRSSPWEAVNVVVSAPACSEPCTVPAAPASDCISMTRGTVPHRLGCPRCAQASASSPMGEAGVIG